jgi:hypothetical protein
VYIRKVRKISLSDNRRRCFRSLSVLSAVESNVGLSYRKIPVSIYVYLLNQHVWNDVQSDEDERKVDLLDMLSCTSSAIEGMDPWRCYFYPITEQDGLPTYHHYLDELSVPTEDLRELIKIITIMKHRIKSSSPYSLSRRTLDRRVGILPATDFISWETFDEIFAIERV